jgi:hypothetical protein
MGLGILNPAGAVALVAVAVLIALYLYGRRHRPVPVSSLLLWRRLPPEMLQRRRPRLDLLFLAQLATLLALITGYLRPFHETPARGDAAARLLLVLDLSASMQARENGDTRFALARRRARALVAALRPVDEVMLLGAAERAHVLLRWTTDHARAQERLETVAPSDTASNLAVALDLALGEAEARAATRVAVLTDLAPEAGGVAVERLSATHWIQIGRTDDNVGIASLAVEQAPFRPAREATATVLLRNYAHSERRVLLEARAGGRPWAARELTLPARAFEHVRLSGPPEAGEIALELRGGDALSVDDRALGYVVAEAPLDLLVVTDRLEHGAVAELRTAVPEGRVEVMERTRYERERPSGWRTVLFDGHVPAEAPLVPALYAAPPPGNPLCPSEGTVEGAAVIDWEEHAAVAGLGPLQALAVARTSQLATPPWGAAVVVAASESAAFPFVVAGERDGRRIVCLGAELPAGPASSDTLPLLVLTLSLLRWLEHSDAVLTVQTGVPTLTAFEGGTDVPAGLRIAGDPAVLVAERAGSYRLGGRLVLANLFDDRESDIGRQATGERRPPATVTLAGVHRREIGWWLYALAAVLLGLEWALWRVRTRAVRR